MSLFLLQTPVPPPGRAITALRPPKPLVRFPPPRSLPASDEDLLHSLASGATHLPGVRSYENDLARLTLVGAVPVDQDLTAVAADGGDAAREHLAAGMQTMVVETVYPGSQNEHSTISTRLLEPLCIFVVEKIKDSLGYAGEIVFDPNIGAWTGDLPTYFKEESNSGVREDISSSAKAMVDNADFQSLYEKNSGAQLSFAQDIASYQVLLSQGLRFLARRRLFLLSFCCRSIRSHGMPWHVNSKCECGKHDVWDIICSLFL